MIGSPTIAEDVVGEYMRLINGSMKSAEGINQYVQSITNKPFEHFFALHIIEQIKDLDLQLIYDEEDKQTPIHHADVLLKAYPQARLTKTKGLGHTRILQNEGVIEQCLESMRVAV